MPLSSLNTSLEQVQALLDDLEDRIDHLSTERQNLVSIELEHMATQIRDWLKESGKPVEPHEIDQKVLARKQAEEALRESEERARSWAAELEALMDAVPAIIWITRDPEAKEMVGNRFGYEFLGMWEGANISKTAPVAELMQQPYRNFKDGVEIPHEDLPMQKAASSGVGTSNYEFDVVFDNGVTKNVLGNVIPLFDQNGKPYGAVGAFLDITERKRIENELRKSETQLQTWKEYISFWDQATNSIHWFFGPDGTFLDPILPDVSFNGKPRVVAQGWIWLEAIHPEDREALRRKWQEMIEQQSSSEAEARVWHEPSQQFRWYFHKAVPFSKDGAFLGWVGASVDIQVRKEIEQALKDREDQLVWSERRFRAMADGTPVIIWVSNTNAQNEFVNQAYLEFFGVTLEQIQSEGWQPLLHPDDAARYVQINEECYRERKPFHAQSRVRHFNGEWRWIDAYGQPRFSESGEFLGMVGSALDITEQKHAERYLEHYTKELERVNQTLKDFTSIASHDLQEPLRKVKAFGQKLDMRYSDELGEQGKDYLERMTSAAERMSDMLNDLLDYSRVTSHGERFTDVDLNQEISGVLSDLEVRLLETGGMVEIAMLPHIQGDPMQIRQLFQNLIGNALKYHRPGEPPLVTIRADRSENGETEITVQDNGIGFNPESADTLFEPFKRLHGRSEYEGTGMGLAICKKIVERHGGRIFAASLPGEGAAFTVTFPMNQ
ncbi:MAG: PAS domain S-box protein [Chloroflexi bacterium]|nr:MAG: PAS domain S-box protein [Chloroflexota bacterium]